MKIVDVDDSRLKSPSRTASSEGWYIPGAESAFLKWTEWTLVMATVMMTTARMLASQAEAIVDR